jgi:DNA-binding NarL/FixJ family response regulator
MASNPTPVEELAAATLLLTAAGYSVTPPAETHWAPTRVHLSPREAQVASLLVDGASNKAIARTLGISVHTAKFHVAAILEKLGARNRADAVAIVLREGLVSV